MPSNINSGVCSFYSWIHCLPLKKSCIETAVEDARRCKFKQGYPHRMPGIEIPGQRRHRQQLFPTPLRRSSKDTRGHSKGCNPNVLSAAPPRNSLVPNPPRPSDVDASALKPPLITLNARRSNALKHCVQILQSSGLKDAASTAFSARPSFGLNVEPGFGF